MPNTLPGHQYDRSAGSVMCGRIRGHSDTVAQFVMGAKASRGGSWPVQEGELKLSREKQRRSAGAAGGGNSLRRAQSDVGPGRTATPPAQEEKYLKALTSSAISGVRASPSSPSKSQRRGRLAAPGSAQAGRSRVRRPSNASAQPQCGRQQRCLGSSRSFSQRPWAAGSMYYSYDTLILSFFICDDITIAEVPPQRPGSDGRDGVLAGEDQSARRTPRALLGLRTERDWDSPVCDVGSAERGELRPHSGSRSRRPRPPPASPSARGGENRRDTGSCESGGLSC
ncbi:hypothetical protein NDU88_001540 [Pleurodeles waltl]|uniref:Uncharacterized protein n=1 Tax=Pleurodeles waltl TaxID=8319 RepID=A0AAV7U755_PLEWA|nr:hypothetical protein NDU88_001540 [Pleurodeles waltl]